MNKNEISMLLTFKINARNQRFTTNYIIICKIEACNI